MDAFLHKAKNIHTVEEAKALLWEEIPSPLPETTKALELAYEAHEGQIRKSGEAYIVHPILVAAITAKISNDEMMVQAALLHDVVEDTHYTIEELLEIFGDDVAHMVEGLTKIVEIRDEFRPFGFYQAIAAGCRQFFNHAETDESTAAEAPQGDDPAATGEPAQQAAAGLQSRVDEINSRVAGWAYQIPSYKADQMKKRVEDLLKSEEES